MKEKAKDFIAVSALAVLMMFFGAFGCAYVVFVFPFSLVAVALICSCRGVFWIIDRLLAIQNRGKS